MQPYIFPYIGYYQLLNAVDTFVILDDVNFIKRGWINRNNILLNGKAHLFSLPLSKPSQNKLICDTKMNFTQKDRSKVLKTFEMAYKKATYYQDFLPTLECIMNFESDDLTEFLHNSLQKVADYAGVKTKILRSTKIKKDNSLVAEERILEICRQLDTNLYVNLSGGMELYNHYNFKNEGIELKFIKSLFDKIEYKQFGAGFVENLSFLDVLMFNSKEEIGNLLGHHSLINGDADV